MHIPDGFINGATSLGAGVVAAGGLGAGLRQAGLRLREKQVPLAGLLAAFIFVLQMLNFPVLGGTSGHLLGGALAAVLVGPAVGMVVVSVVVIVQALMFADGGLSALGLNILNMAVVTTLVGWGGFRVARSVLPRTYGGIVASSFLGALLSVVASAMAFVLEYGWGGAGGVSLTTVAAAMGGVHVLIGFGEGAITGTVVGAVLAARPDLVHGATGIDLGTSTRMPVKRLLLVAAATCVFLVVVVAPLASSSPDGLERVAIDLGFASSATESLADQSPLAGYGESTTGTIVSGLVGFGVTLAAGFGLLAIWRRRKGQTRSVR